MNLVLVILLVLFGVALLVIEMFLIPGVGLCGVGGVASLIAGVSLAYWKLTPLYPWAGHITLFAAIILTGIAIYAFLKSRAIQKMSLDTTIDGKVELASKGKHLEHLEQTEENDVKSDNENK